MQRSMGRQSDWASANMLGEKLLALLAYTGPVTIGSAMTASPFGLLPGQHPPPPRSFPTPPEAIHPLPLLRAGYCRGI